LFVSVGLAISLVSLVIFSVLAPKHTSYVGFQLLFRLEEIWIVGNMLIFLEQRKTRKNVV